MVRGQQLLSVAASPITAVSVTSLIKGLLAALAALDEVDGPERALAKLLELLVRGSRRHGGRGERVRWDERTAVRPGSQESSLSRG